MRLVIDMNRSPKWVDFLRDAGFEADHWSNLGPADAPDAVLMALAVEHGGVILTHDLDFGSILAASGGVGPSVVQLRADDLRAQAIGRNVISALGQMADALADGALVTIDPARTRVSVLPLQPFAP